MIAEISENKHIVSMKRSILLVKLLVSIPWVPLQNDDSSDILLHDLVWLVKNTAGSSCVCTVHGRAPLHALWDTMVQSFNSIFHFRIYEFSCSWRTSQAERQKVNSKDQLAHLAVLAVLCLLWKSRLSAGYKKKAWMHQKGNHFLKWYICPLVATSSAWCIHSSGP